MNFMGRERKVGVEPLSLTCLFGNSERPLFDLLLFLLSLLLFREKKGASYVCEQLVRIGV